MFIIPSVHCPDRCGSKTFVDDGRKRWYIGVAVPDGKLFSLDLTHQGSVYSIALSRDGTRVVTASADHTARVWDAASGLPLSPPLVHQGAVVSAAFSSDGARVVTASWDRTARVWDAATGKPLSLPLEHQDHVHGAAFDADGTRVVTASNDHTARVWNLQLASGTLEDWRAIVERSSPYVLANGVLLSRPQALVERPELNKKRTDLDASPPWMVQHLQQLLKH